MQDQPATDKQSTIERSIESTVQLYVRLKNIAALSELRELRVNRLKFLLQCADTEQFSFSLLREHCQKDIRAIDAGLLELAKDEPLRGHVGVFSFQKIAGWAQYVEHPETPVTLGIYFDNELAVQVVADCYRRDLEAANLGSGHHGFNFVPSKELFLSSEVIEVKAPNGKVIAQHKNR
jgi:hypothetical protein